VVIPTSAIQGIEAHTSTVSFIAPRHHSQIHKVSYERTRCREAEVVTMAG
jgi:hypothetical protein